ncbi:MAG: hypothetical protein P8X96_26160, partial [Desulfobacteraceae bacterium]
DQPGGSCKSSRCTNQVTDTIESLSCIHAGDSWSMRYIGLRQPINILNILYVWPTEHHMSTACGDRIWIFILINTLSRNYRK